MKVLFPFVQHIRVVFDDGRHGGWRGFGQQNGRNRWAFARTNSLDVHFFYFLLVNTGFVKSCKTSEVLALRKIAKVANHVISSEECPPQSRHPNCPSALQESEGERLELV
jgi:hypothetical protein